MAKLTTIQRARSDEKTSFLWENEEEKDAHKAFTAWADRTRDLASSVERRKRNLLYASMYANLPMLGFGVNQYTRSQTSNGVISLNVTQNAIDSLVAKVCKNDPRPMFDTVRADYELREKAENADRYVDGVLTNGNFYDQVYPGAVLDECIYGLGIMKAHAVDGDPVSSRVYCHEMIIDERQAMYGEPPRIGQRKYYDKQVLFNLCRRDSDKEWTEGLEEAIDAGGPENDPDFDDFDRDETSDQIQVYEGYVTAQKRAVGKKILCIRGYTISFQDYRYKDTPYTFMTPMVTQHGLYGIGCAEKIMGIQREINRIVRDVQSAMNLIAKPHWMVENSSNVTAAMLNNDMATIIKYTGTMPIVYKPEAMSAEVYQHLQFLYRTAYEILGVSQLSAQSQKPGGIDSAVGLRTYLNVETERFSQFVKGAEKGASTHARKTARVISDENVTTSVLASTKYTGNMKCTWMPLEMDDIRVRCQPTSKLPDTEAGRREFALELAQYGVADKLELYEMLEWGDTESFAKRKLAGRKNIEREIALIRSGKNVIRDAIGDHEVARSMMSDAYEEGKMDFLPEKRLAVMRKYIKACSMMLAKKPAPVPMGPSLQPPPALGPGPGGPPIPGAPGAGPPILPNAPMAPEVPQ